VFNYYPPSYVVPGTTSIGPEFAIQNSATAINRYNFGNGIAFGNHRAARHLARRHRDETRLDNASPRLPPCGRARGQARRADAEPDDAGRDAHRGHDRRQRDPGERSDDAREDGRCISLELPPSTRWSADMKSIALSRRVFLRHAAALSAPA